MKPTANAWLQLLKCCALLFLAACTTFGSQVLYTFTATTQATLGSPSQLEQSELAAPEFLPLAPGGDLISFLRSDTALLSCLACADPPIFTLHFLRSEAEDIIQFRDADGILRPYFFAANALGEFGVHNTLPGINVAVGQVIVSNFQGEVPEPSTIRLVAIGASVMWFALWRRRTGSRRSPAAAAKVATPLIDSPAKSI
jgi:hypothetical protein